MRDDAYDYPDIPGPADLSESYRDSLRSPAVREAIAKRQAELAKEKAPERQAAE